MIPYFSPPSLTLGPLTLEVFGVFVVVGVLVGSKLASLAAARRGLDRQVLLDFAPWGVLAGVVAGHLVHLFLYHPEELTTKGPLQILKVWDGLSSFGGLLGGVIAAYFFFRKRGLSFERYGDALALGVAPGWGLARVGCFMVHDHPGRLTDFFLAVQFPAAQYGGARHDLGLYEALMLFAIAGVLGVLFRRGALAGRLLPLLALTYGAGRFGLDFLRATDLHYVDARYLGLTPAQYGSILLVGYGIARLARHEPQPAEQLPAGKQRSAERPARRVGS